MEFNFNKFTNREDILDALSVLRHVSGITRIGGAFEFALSILTKKEHVILFLIIIFNFLGYKTSKRTKNSIFIV